MSRLPSVVRQGPFGVSGLLSGGGRAIAAGVLAALAGCTPDRVPLDSDRPPDPTASDVQLVASPTEPGTGGTGSAGAVGSVTVGWASLAIDDQGVATVSWIALDDADRATVLVARSPSPGAPFGAPVEVAGPVRPNVGAVEKPSLAVRGDQTVLAWAGTPQGRHGDSTQVVVHVAEEGLDFDEGRIVDDLTGQGSCGAYTPPVTEHATAAVAPDGEVWLAWKQQCYGASDRIVHGRESVGFAPEVVDARFTVHDCSPFGLGFTPDGTALLAFRGVQDRRRETWIARAAPGSGFGPAEQLSDDDWPYSDICPPEGPRLAIGGGETLVSWAAPTRDGEEAYAWIVGSEGSGWSEADPHGIAGSWVEWSSVAVEEGGRAWHAAEDWAEGALLRVREAGDWRAHSVDLPGGGPLRQPELASGGGRSALLGLTDAGELWLVELGP